MSDPVLQAGDRVRMTPALKALFRQNGSRAHVREFGHCVGTVEGPRRCGNGDEGPELEVRWWPSRLRYAYHPKYLRKA